MVPARFVVIFAMAVATVQGDTCTNGNAAYKLKTSLGNLKCNSDLSLSSCNNACCEMKDGTCLKLTNTCPNTHYKDSDKYANAATSTTFSANCCTTKKKCDITCPIGMKDKTTKATTDCAGKVCSSTECCEPNPLTCKGAILAMGTNTLAQAAQTTLLQQYTECGTEGKVPVEAKSGEAVKADYTDFKTVCCVPKVTCSAACPTGMKDKSGKASKKCASVPCTDSDCCDPDTTKCQYNSKKCPNTHYIPTAKKNNAVKADGSDFDAQCCILKETCTAFKDKPTSTGTASGSTRQMVATSSVFAMAGFILASKYI